MLLCCFTSTEARWLIRDGDREGRGRKSEGLTADTARKRPERPWTAARTMEVLRRCPLAIAQRLVHCAIAVSTAVLGQSHKDNVRCTAVDEQLAWTTRSKRSPTFSAQLHLPTHDLFWANSTVQLHLPPLRSLDLLISPGTLALRAQRTGFNTLDNWGHKTPTQLKRKRTGKKRLKGHGPKYVYNTLGYK